MKKRGEGSWADEYALMDKKHRLKLNNNQPKSLFKQNSDDIFMLISI